MKAPVRGKRNNAVCANPADLPSVPHLRSRILLAWTLQRSPQHRKLSPGVLKVICQFLDYRRCLTQIFRRSITAYYIPTMDRALLSDINPRVPSSTQLMASVCIGENLIFACGGYTHQTLNSAYLWSVDDLKRLRPMLYPRVNHQLVFYERFRSVYVFGGVDSRELIRCERFHLPSAEWHFLPPMHRQRKDLVLSRHLTSVYICGSDSALEVFDLLSESFSLIGEIYVRDALFVVVHNDQIVALSDGKIRRWDSASKVRISEYDVKGVFNPVWGTVELHQDRVFFIPRSSSFMASFDLKQFTFQFST